MTDQNTDMAPEKKKEMLDSINFRVGKGLEEIRVLILGTLGKEQNFISMFSTSVELQKVEKFILEAGKKINDDAESRALTQFKYDLSELSKLSKMILSRCTLMETEVDRLNFVFNTLDKFDLTSFARLHQNGLFLAQACYGKDHAKAISDNFGLSGGLDQVTIKGPQMITRYPMALKALAEDIQKLENFSGIKHPDGEKILNFHDKFKALTVRCNAQENLIDDIKLTKSQVSAKKDILFPKRSTVSPLGLSRYFRNSQTEALRKQLKLLIKDIERFVEIPGNIRSQENLEHIDRSMQIYVEALDIKVAFTLSKIVSRKEDTVDLKRFNQLFVTLTEMLKLREELKLNEKIPNKEIDRSIKSITENIGKTLENVKLNARSSEQLSQLTALMEKVEKEFGEVKEVKSAINVGPEKIAVASPEVKQTKTLEGSTDLGGFERLKDLYSQASRHNKQDPSYLKEMKKLLEATEKEIVVNPKAAVSLNQFKSLLLRDCPDLKPKIPARPTAQVSQQNEQKITASMQKEQAPVSRGPLPKVPRKTLRAP